MEGLLDDYKEYRGVDDEFIDDEDLIDPFLVDPVASRYFEDVGDYYLPLTREEEKALVKDLEEKRKALQRHILGTVEGREHLYSLASTLRGNPRGSGTIAKLGSDFNNKKRGHNATINARLERALATGEVEELLAADFKHSIFESYARRTGLYEKDVKAIQEREHRLFQCAIRMLRTVAKRYGSDVYGIEESDCIQQANEAALMATKTYRSGSRARFVTYAYWWAEKKIKDWIMYNSRLVYLPQRKLERVFLVLKASNTLTEPIKHNVAYLAKESQLTEREVEEALLHLSGNALPIDQPLNGGGESTHRPLTLSDSLADATVDIEDQIDFKRLLQESEDEVLRHLEPLEAGVIYFRYLDPSYNPKRAPILERPYSEICANLIEAGLTDRVLSREKIRLLEHSGLERLRRGSEWFWTRLRDDILADMLSSRECDAFFLLFVTPQLRRIKPSWAGAAKDMGCSPRCAMGAYRNAIRKIRAKLPTIAKWIDEQR